MRQNLIWKSFIVLQSLKSCQIFSASRIVIAYIRNVPNKCIFHEIFACCNNDQPLWRLLRILWILWIFPSEMFQRYFCENLCRFQQRSTSVAAAQTTTPCTWTPRNINHLVLPSLVLFWFFCNSHLNWIDWESISLKLASKQLSVKRFSYLTSILIIVRVVEGYGGFEPTIVSISQRSPRTN